MVSPNLRSVADVIAILNSPHVEVLPKPEYDPPINPTGWKIFLAAKSMSTHTADAGWQLTQALADNHYTLCGTGLAVDELHVPTILDMTKPSTVIVQDKREWMGMTARAANKFNEKFKDIECLKNRTSMFKMTVLKDAQQKPEFHRDSADEIGCHGWITYYHPKIVKHVAPYVREEHLVRTYHTIDKDVIPPFHASTRTGCILSGAISQRHYPLRLRLFRTTLPDTYKHRHPGYGCTKLWTPHYLRLLSKYRVSICTSSIYGYSLRKIVEATACGARVITDLPEDDVLPKIDGNLYRIPPDSTNDEVRDTIQFLIDTYDEDVQESYARKAQEYYDWRASGKRLSQDIEMLRRDYYARS